MTDLKRLDCDKPGRLSDDVYWNTVDQVIKNERTRPDCL
jgi:hypothetical protein